MQLFNREDPQNASTDKNLEIKLNDIEKQQKKEIMSEIETIFKNN